MAENRVSATDVNRNLSISRVNARQAEDQAERQAQIIARQEASQETRTRVSVETQTGKKVNISV